MGSAALPPVRHRDADPDRPVAEARRIHVGRRRIAGDASVERALRHMSDNHDMPLTVAELADVAELRSHEFLGRFMRATGRTPEDHLLGLRVTAAQTAMLETDLDLVSVALLCGFGSGDDLSASFRARVGASPAEWRAARR